MFEIDLTTTEIDLYKKLGIDVGKVHNEVVTFVGNLMPSPSAADFSITDITTNLTSALSHIQPAFSDIPEEAGKKYKGSIENTLKEAFKRCKRLTKHEVQAVLTRHFLGLLDRKDEYDSIVCDRKTSCIFHIETKSFSQGGKNEIFGFSNNLEKADLQLAKGREVFNHIIGPAVSLPSTWTWVSLLAFPNIRSRQALRDLGVAV